MERQRSGLRHRTQGFHNKQREVGVPSVKPPPKAVKKWAVNAEALASLATATAESEEQVEDCDEDTSELTGLNFDE